MRQAFNFACLRNANHEKPTVPIRICESRNRFFRLYDDFGELSRWQMACGIQSPCLFPVEMLVLELDVRRARNQMPIRTRILVDFDGLGHIWFLSQIKQHYTRRFITSLRQPSPVDERSDFPLCVRKKPHFDSPRNSGIPSSDKGVIGTPFNGTMLEFGAN
jgi:hypothetical protein